MKKSPTADADEGAYRELLEKNARAEAERTQYALDETSSIISMIQENRRIAGQAQSASVASVRYYDNETFKAVNSGNVPRIDVRHCVHPLSPEECDVYTKLAEDPKTSITAMPNHCITELGDAEGFRFQCDASLPASKLPICREMFFRHSVVECTGHLKGTQRELPPAGEPDRTLLAMLMRQKEMVGRLVSVVQSIHKRSQRAELSMDMMPESRDYADTGPSD